MHNIANDLIDGWNKSVSNDLIPKITFDGRMGFYISMTEATYYAETLRAGGAIKRISKAWRKKLLIDLKKE